MFSFEDLEGRRLLASVPVFDHIVVVMEENQYYGNIIGSSEAPYINSLAQQGALFTNSFGVAYPSQLNYLALFSGSTQGIFDNNNHGTFSGENLYTELNAVGKSFAGIWRAFRTKVLPATNPGRTCGSTTR
jgi:phosphatidylinositol-3-phosphatase